MESLTRRHFGWWTLAAAGSRAWGLQFSGGPPAASAFTMVAAIDRERVLRLAEGWLPEPPQTITAFPSPKSPGDAHDFFSEADYFWPNPLKPDGPYKEIDGKSNPDNFQDHRRAMIRLSVAMPALTAGYLLTRREEFGRAAAAHLLAWFVTPDTRMTPNLQFAQGYHNGPTGRSYGIIDTLHLVEVARAAGFVRSYLPETAWAGVQAWFREYLEWMKTSKPGMRERDATNNHAICWALQAAEFARLAGDEITRDEVRMRFERQQLPQQMRADGGIPRELARTKPFGYSIFNFDVAATLCWSLSTPGSKGDVVRFALPDGRGMCRGAEFLEPYMADKSRWTLAHDVQHWESWPVRSPGLLFCGLACGRQDYIALWRRLDADPTDPEVIRNFPVRQPVLWVA